MKKPKVDYEFKCINAADYEIEITFPVENRLLMIIFNKSKEKLKRTKNISASGNIDNIDGFDIEKIYHNFLNTRIRPWIRDIEKQVKEDHIVILNNYIKKARFIRNKENKDWRVYIIVEGQYVDKR